MKDNKIKQKISKLEKKIKVIETEKTKCRKNAEYNNRELRKSATENNFKKYEKLFAKENFYRSQMEELDSTIDAYKNEITELNNRLNLIDFQRKEREYKKSLNAFYKEMLVKLKNLVNDANNLHELKPFNPNTPLETYNFYTQEQKKYKKEDIIFFDDLMKNIVVNFAVLQEKLVTVIKAPAAAREGVRLGKFATLKNLIVRHIESVIEEIEKRTEKSTVEKLTGLFSK